MEVNFNYLNRVAKINVEEKSAPISNRNIAKEVLAYWEHFF